MMLCHSSRGAAWKFIVKESLDVRFDPFPFPLTLPHFDNVDKASNVGRVRFRVGKTFSHCLAIHRVRFLWVVVALRAAVKETAVKLVCCSRICAPPVNRKFAYSLLTTVDLVADAVSRSDGFPR